MIELNGTISQALTGYFITAQAAEADAVNWLPIILILILVVVAIVGVAVARKRAADRERKPKVKAEPRGDAAIPSADLLADREEVEEAVEVHEGMSLAEIKRAKRAKVVGKKTRRETAKEATTRSQEELEAEKGDESPEAPEETDLEEKAVEEEAVEEEAVEEEAVEEEAPEVPEPEEAKGLGEESSISLPKPKRKQTPSPRSEAATTKLPRPKLPRPAGLKPKVDEAREEEKSEIETPPIAEEEAPVAAVEEAPEEAPKVDEGKEEEAAAAEKAERKEEIEEPEETAEEAEEKSLREGLEKTRTGFIDRLGNLFRGDRLDEDLVESVEEILFTADIGAKIAQNILATVEESLSSDQKSDPGEVWTFIRTYCEEILSGHEEPIDYDSASPFVMLVIGVNGVGKTTTIGKMASQLQREGKSVMLVAGDTFRAAAVDQLEVWAKRAAIPMHRGEDGADPSSVIYAGIEKGMAEGADVIICDTAGRLHTKSNLLDELSKMARVAGKAVDGAPHETVLVLDANTGQNAIAQAKLFNEALDITGVVLTKLDGTAKGGVILGICDELKAPVRYIGIGEGIRDLRRFDAQEFVEALFM